LLGEVFAGQSVGVTQVGERIWLDSNQRPSGEQETPQTVTGAACVGLM